MEVEFGRGAGGLTRPIHDEQEEDDRLERQEQQQREDDEAALDRLAQFLDDDGVEQIVYSCEQTGAFHCTSPFVTFMKISSRPARRGRNSTRRKPCRTRSISRSQQLSSLPATSASSASSMRRTDSTLGMSSNCLCRSSMRSSARMTTARCCTSSCMICSRVPARRILPRSMKTAPSQISANSVRMCELMRMALPCPAR